MPDSARPDIYKNANQEKIQPGIAVFVMSCDKTSDVARHFVAAFARYWPDCPYPVYFGINRDQTHLASIGATPLPSEVKGWKEETLYQLQSLRRMSPGITHLLVFLDDFILSERVNTEQVRRMLADGAAKDVAYLRLRRLEEGLWGDLKQKVMKGNVFGNEACIPIRSDHPYYSSLQIALWKLDCLQTLLEQSDTIWGFECLRDAGNVHYAVLKSLIHYRHVVEKGKWDIIAKAHCLKAIGWFDDRGRPGHLSGFRARFERRLGLLRFKLFGYLPMRLKKRIYQSD